MMRNWEIEKKAAATLVLALVGLGYLAGLANLALNVGLRPAQVQSRYAAKPPAQNLEAMLEEAPEISPRKLAHIVHAHMIPYALVFSLCAFFVIHFQWTARGKIIFLLLFALSIPMDFLGMAGARFIHPSLYIVILGSGAVFGASLATVIVWSMRELWL